MVSNGHAILSLLVVLYFYTTNHVSSRRKNVPN